MQVVGRSGNGQMQMQCHDGQSEQVREHQISFGGAIDQQHKIAQPLGRNAIAKPKRRVRAKDHVRTGQLDKLLASAAQTLQHPR